MSFFIWYIGRGRTSSAPAVRGSHTAGTEQKRGTTHSRYLRREENTATNKKKAERFLPIHHEQQTPPTQVEHRSTCFFFSHREGTNPSFAKRNEGFAYRRHKLYDEKLSTRGICVARRTKRSYDLKRNVFYKYSPSSIPLPPQVEHRSAWVSFLTSGGNKSLVRKAERGIRIPQAQSISRETKHPRYLRREEHKALKI